jgi:hypothetical protein
MATQETNEPKGEGTEAQAEENSETSEPLEGESGETSEEGRRPASARFLSRPATALPIAGVGDITGLKASLVGETPGPTLEEIRRVNQEQGGDSRTPLMTVIQAIIRDRGGSMPLADLCSAVTEHWNRPFPASPYSPEEFIYVMARNSDHILITH